MKDNPKKPKPESSLKRHIFVLYIAALVLLLGLTGVVGLLIRPLQQDNSANTFVMRSYIKEAIEGLSRQTIIDPKEKKEYIFEASVRFPTEAGHSFRYAYYKADPGTNSKEAIQVAANEIMLRATADLNTNDMKQLFNNVPRLQACSREFYIQFEQGVDDDESRYTLAKTISLADGRTAYLYKNTACANFYNSNELNVDDHQKILEKLESY